MSQDRKTSSSLPSLLLPIETLPDPNNKLDTFVASAIHGGIKRNWNIQQLKQTVKELSDEFKEKSIQRTKMWENELRKVEEIINNGTQSKNKQQPIIIDTSTITLPTTPTTITDEDMGTDLILDEESHEAPTISPTTANVNNVNSQLQHQQGFTSVVGGKGMKHQLQIQQQYPTTTTEEIVLSAGDIPSSILPPSPTPILPTTPTSEPIIIQTPLKSTISTAIVPQSSSDMMLIDNSSFSPTKLSTTAPSTPTTPPTTSTVTKGLKSSKQQMLETSPSSQASTMDEDDEEYKPTEEEEKSNLIEDELDEEEEEEEESYTPVKSRKKRRQQLQQPKEEIKEIVTPKKKKRTTASSTRRRKKKPSEQSVDQSGESDQESFLSAEDEGYVASKSNSGLNSSVPQYAFWDYVNSFFPVIKKDRLKLLEQETSEDDESFEIPNRGKHYTEKWEEENKRLFNFNTKDMTASTVTTNTNNNSTTLSIDKASNQAFQSHSLTQRLLSSLIEERDTVSLENIINDTERRTLRKPPETSALEQQQQNELDRHFKNKQQIMKTHLQQSQQLISLSNQYKDIEQDIHITNLDYTPQQMTLFEDKLLGELKNIGLIPVSQTSPNLWVADELREDDEICAEIRTLQNKLREQMQKTNEFRMKILKRVKAQLNDEREIERKIQQLTNSLKK
ncbi:hypothetical protein ABK040_000965 [Willaertia magna]